MEQNTIYILKLVAPLIVIELFLKVFCFYKLSKDEVKYISKISWFFIILLVNTFGPIVYLLIGRKKD